MKVVKFVDEDSESRLDHLVRTSGSNDLVIEMAAGFGMTETWFVISVSYILLHPDFSSAGSIYNCIQCSLSNPGEYLPSSEFLPLGHRNRGMGMCIVSLEDGVTLLRNGESDKLQLRGPMMFTKYYNYPTVTNRRIVLCSCRRSLLTLSTSIDRNAKRSPAPFTHAE